MALNDLGLEVPAGTDMFDPDGDMRGLGDSLEGRIIVPVANVTERDALASTLAPTPATPLYVHRADAPSYARLEWTEDNSTWRPIFGGDTGWLDCTLISGWGGTCKAKFSGDQVEIRADLPVGPSVANGAFYKFASLPASIPPPAADPGPPARGDCWMGADGGHAYCTVSGDISVINGTGAARSAITCTIKYTVD